MILKRETDATFINAIANHASVREHMLGKGLIDYTPVIKNTANVVLTGPMGGMVFHQLVPGFFEIHTQVLPEGRGAWALEMAQSALLWIFTRTVASEVMTRVPDGNLPARDLTRRCGGVLEQKAFIELDGEQVGWSIYRMTIQDWLKTSPYLEERGRMFHVKLHGEYDRLGLKIERHGDDPWHNRHAGAAAFMIAGGQVAKGIGYYNRWAGMALAPMISLASVDPLIVNIQDAYLKINGDDFEVMENPSCRAA